MEMFQANNRQATVRHLSEEDFTQTSDWNCITKVFFIRIHRKCRFNKLVIF